MDKGNTFESQWQHEFEGAEVTPPPHVWNGIDAELSKMEAKQYRNKAIVYKWVAAASVAAIATLATLQFSTTDYIVDSDRAVAVIEQSDAVTANDNGSVAETESVVTRSAIIKNNGATVIAASNSESIDDMSSLMGEEQEEQVEAIENNQGHILATVDSKPVPSAQLPKQEREWMYGVAYQRDVAKKLHESDANLWAGVSVGAGSFDPGFSGGTADQVNGTQFGSNGENQSPNYTSGNSVSGGLDVGTRVAKRIVVSSGVHYNAFNTGSANASFPTSASNNGFFAKTNTEQSPNARTLDVSTSEEVSTRNEFQYLTIPFKAGYVVLDKRFNITVNSGLSSNILMNAQLLSEGGEYDQESTEEYKPVYFNFLSSVAFGYALKEKYLFTVEPNYNQAISDFTDSNTTTTGKPRNFGVSMGVRYKF